MAGVGQIYRAGSIADPPESNIGDREYGLWNTEFVKQFGYFSAPSPAEQVLNEDSANGGQSWADALDSCSAQPPVELRDLIPSNEETTKSLVARIRTEAYNAASSDPAWQSARELWWGCLRKAGLDPRTGAGEWNTRQAYDLLMTVGGQGQPANSEELIRVAYAEAKCNDETGMAQTLGNLEAAYQPPLIDRNQAALNSEKQRKQDRLATARKYVAANG